MGNPMHIIKCNDCAHEEHLLWGYTKNRDFLSVYYCSNCKKIKQVTIKENEQKQDKYFCDKCKNILEKIDINTTINENFKQNEKMFTTTISP